MIVYEGRMEAVEAAIDRERVEQGGIRTEGLRNPL